MPTFMDDLVHQNCWPPCHWVSNINHENLLLKANFISFFKVQRHLPIINHKKQVQALLNWELHEQRHRHHRLPLKVKTLLFRIPMRMILIIWNQQQMRKVTDGVAKRQEAPIYYFKGFKNTNKLVTPP